MDGLHSRANAAPPIRLRTLGRLVGRGEYVYRANGARVDVAERWLRFESPSGDVVTLSARESVSHRSRIRVRAREHDGRIVEVGVRWRSAAPGAVPACDAEYAIGPHEISAIRRLGGGEERAEARVEAAVAAPLMRVFMGRTICDVAERGGAPVLVPWLLEPNDAGRLLAPHIEHRRARRLAEERVEIEDGAETAVRYEYVGDRYDADARFWVGADGLLVRYAWREWDVRLRRLG